MSAWFSKVFEKRREHEVEVSEAVEEAAEHLEAVNDDAADDDGPAYATPKPPRTIINPTVLVAETGATTSASGVRIKARLDEANNTCTFLVDRPVLAGHSFWAPDRDTANAHAPLAAAIFDLGEIDTVLLHETNVTVTRAGVGGTPWEEKAREIGAQIRAHLESGVPVVAPDYMDKMPSEGEIRDALQTVIDQQINPGIASHSGVIILDRVVGNTAYITMGGGCQGCAASSITLRSGVEGMFRSAMPYLGALLDQTDHEAGTNPFFTELPAGMGA